MKSYQLSTCITDFLFHCEFERNLSDKTLKAYEADLRQCSRFLLAQQPDMLLTQLGKEEIKAYLKSLNHAKPKTIKRKMASLKAMLAFVEYEHESYANPFRRLKLKIKEEIKIPTTLSISEMGSILKAAYQNLNKETRTPHAYTSQLRTVAVLELLFASGIRVSELCSLKNAQVNLEEGTLLIKGKGRKERLIHLCQHKVIESLKQYRADIEQDEEDASNAPFFLNRLNRSISPESVRRIVREAAKAAGLSKHITPHTFRHSFATLILEEGVDIRYIQSFLGHSSIVTTQLYTRVNAGRQREILATKHPRMRLEI